MPNFSAPILEEFGVNLFFWLKSCWSDLIFNKTSLVPWKAQSSNRLLFCFIAIFIHGMTLKLILQTAVRMIVFFCGTVHFHLIVFYSLHVVFDGRISARKATFFSCFFVSLPKIIAKHNIVLFFIFLLLVNACWFFKENLHFLLLFFFLKTLAALKILLQDFNHDKTVLFFASTFSLLWYSIHIDISRRTHYDGVEFFDDSIMMGGLHRPRYTVVTMSVWRYQFSTQTISEWLCVISIEKSHIKT